MFARTARWSSACGLIAAIRLEQRFDRRADPIHDRAQVPRLIFRRARQLLECRQNRAAARVAEHHDEARVEALRGKLHRAHLRRRHDVPGDADHEQVAQALVEHDLCRDARIRAAEDDGERLLPGGQLAASRLTRQRVRSDVGNKAAVPLAQGFESVERWDHRRGILGGICPPSYPVVEPVRQVGRRQRGRS